VPRAELVEWRERFGVVAGITERGPDGGFSLGLASREPVGAVVERWRALRQAVRPAFPALQRAHQVHRTTVKLHDGVAPGWHEADDADGHITRQRGLLLTVSVADCVPIYLITTDATAVALLHAGWRGTAGGMLEAGLRRLCEVSNSSPGDVAMHCGVAICDSCYEVGEEVARAVLGPSARPGKQHLDLRAVLAAQAEELGVREVSVSPLCTSCHRDRFFSHRARADGGRMVAYLGMPLRG
jgi:YfiH family protein